VFVDPDCGLKTRTVEEARAKMQAIVEGARRVREELGIGDALPEGRPTAGRNTKKAAVPVAA
jgi:5-methyltetrahydropteroyltriglutamate--homocysteine methyltransferase